MTECRFCGSSIYDSSRCCTECVPGDDVVSVLFAGAPVGAGDAQTRELWTENCRLRGLLTLRDEQLKAAQQEIAALRREVDGEEDDAC